MLDREKKWQERWRENRTFESEPDGRKKFFCTFPYPYVNGLPHVGHLFSIMRTEAFARYHRLRGRNVLFPQGWHATGSPIVAAANRVRENEEKQLAILKDFGVPEEEIPKFTEPEHWITYFAPRYKQDLASVGLAIDWRREFHTTSLNPQYDAFIKWQFAKLKEKEYVRQGSHPVVWCPKDNGPVGDHDRMAGEGETPQEFLLVKHKLPDGRYVVSATLRPDTILGITNLYVNPQTTYKETLVDGETWIIGEAAAKRLAEQDRNIAVQADVRGADLVGKETQEFSGIRVPILPATFLDPNFGTGLVHSVPSDSADDLIALQDLQKSDKMIEQHGLDPEQVKSIKVIEVLDTPGYGGNPAQKFLDEYGVKNQDERKKLDEIRPKLYKLSFYEAKFNAKYEKYGLSGVNVQEGKSQIQKIIIDEGWGATYYQLTGRVVCRCQTESIVKLVSNQWFIAYDDPAWKEQAHKALGICGLYPEKARQQFSYVVDWLKQWACTREYGLGTRLPWDEQWLIESLSDSTIYMAYYTIAHKIKDVPAAQLDEALFDYVYLGKGESPSDFAEELRKEFLYWYPMDFRNSGKDLIQNHLTFMLFNHCAIFPEEHWPRGIGVNGWVTVNGQKMSKSLGNVIPVRKLVAEFGADACRITILNGGEGLDDPNWDSDFARGMHGKLDAFLRLAGNAGTEAKETPVDAWLRSRLHELVKLTTEAMELTNFRSAIQLAFFELGQTVKWYLQRTMGEPNGALLREVVEAQAVMCSPFIPHACEEAWELLGNEGFVADAPWPKIDESAIDASLGQGEEMIKGIVDTLRKSGKDGGTLCLYLAADWKRTAYEEFDKVADATRHPGDVMNALSKTSLNEHGEELSRLVKFMVKSRTPSPVATAEQERAWLEHAKEYLMKEAGVSAVDILDAGNEGKAASGLPGKPAIELR